MLDDADDIITGLRRIADYLGESERHVLQLVRAGELPAVETRGVLCMSREAYWRMRELREAAADDEG